MMKSKKTKEELLEKLGISAQNEMQLSVEKLIMEYDEVLFTSPTGTGKTVAFLIPLLELLDQSYNGVQALIITPTRELGIQINEVLRNMGSGFKTNVVYGGRSIKKDKEELAHLPAIIVGTPGRIADHIRRQTFDPDGVRYLILDEFDKSLEIGFDNDMIDITDGLVDVKKTILTSATSNIDIPRFLTFENPMISHFHDKAKAKLEIKVIQTPEKDKLQHLYRTLEHIGNKTGIIFCNFKDSIQRISENLNENNIAHGIFQGGLEQQERERSLIKFRNGTYRILLATDLAARGIDVPELDFIIHYHLPSHKHEYIHRNGRTARMSQHGVAYILIWEEDELPEYVTGYQIEEASIKQEISSNQWHTLFISGGRKDKISKGDIAGLFIKVGGVDNDDLGIIELKRDCAFVAVHSALIGKVISKLNNSRLKKKKVRIYEI